MGKLAKSKQKKREEIFDLYSQNLNVVKQHPNIQITPEIDNSYMCPICYRIFIRESASTPDILTLDHIPSKKLGGSLGDAVLLCKRCNNDAGKLFDSHLKRILDVGDFAARIPGSSLEGWYTLAEGTKLTATMVFADDGGLQILGHPERSDPKQIALEKVYISSLPPNGELGWEFGGTIGNAHFADVGLLRYAYLMLFRMFGYGAIFYQAMMRTCDQIRNPTEQILPRSWILTGLPMPDDALGISIVTEPEEARAFLVVLDLVTKRRTRHAIVLPNSSEQGLGVYDWLLEKKQAQAEVEFTVGSLPEDAGLLTKPRWAFTVHGLWRP
jgi:hypothetical protein